MRHHSARAVFVACLLAAGTAAQAPSSFRASDYVTPIHGGGGPTPSAPAPAAAPTGSAPAPRGGSPSAQDPDYSLRGMFQQAHGAFMAGRGRYEPMARLDFGVYPNQRVNHEPGSFDMIRYGIDVDVPLVLSPDGYMMLGAYSDSRSFQFSTATGLSDEQVHATGLKFGFGAFLDEDMLLEIETRPGVWSDADGGLHHEDLDMPSHALMTWRAVEGLYWKVGIRYNQIYEDAAWLPYLGLSWDITGLMTPPGSVDAYDGGSWRLDVLLPEYVELSYWPTASTGFQFGAEVDGAEYHVRTARAVRDLFPPGREDLRVQEVTSYLGVVHRFNDMLSASARAGIVIAGDYDLTNGATPPGGFDVVEGALDQGFFARISLGVDW